MSDRPHIVLVGMMGVGKSTTGRVLAAERGMAYVDSDDDIDCLFGMSGAEFAAQHSIAELHSLEASVLLGALASAQPSVISAAGSVVENQFVREVLARRSVVILLVGSLDEILIRQQGGDHRRPMERSELEVLWNRRRPLFELVADVQLAADHEAAELSKEINRQISRSLTTD